MTDTEKLKRTHSKHDSSVLKMRGESDEQKSDDPSANRLLLYIHHHLSTFSSYFKGAIPA